MAPLIVLIVGTLLARGLGRLGVPGLRTWVAAVALIVFLLAVLPANVHAAQGNLTIGGSAVTPLWPRVALQLLFIALVWWTGVRRTAAQRDSAVSP